MPIWHDYCFYYVLSSRGLALKSRINTMRLQVFVGWDPREDIAWQVCRHSILSRTDPGEVTIVPLVQSDLRDRGLYTRAIDTKGSTEFSLTRFLTPFLAGKRGHAIFVDCDFLFLADIREVINEIDPLKAVSVVKHDYNPSELVKMDGCKQYQYPRKNWSSFMMFNLENPAVWKLTPGLVNSAHPSFLHRFLWLADENIGALDKGWNYLEGWYPTEYDRIRAVHYTRGGPWFSHMNDCGFAEEWRREYSCFKGSPHNINVEVIG